MIPTKPKTVLSVDWKRGKIHWANRYEQDPDGWAVRVPEHEQRIESEDAVAYMQALMERARIPVDMLPNWQDGLCVATSPVMDKKLEIPAHTLYLSVSYSFKDRNVMARKDGFVSGQMDDPALAPCVERLVQDERIFRAWLIVRTRRFSPTLPKENTPLGRLYAKPLQEIVTVCTSSLLPLDLI